MGNYFCSTLCVSTQNNLNFVENSKMAKKHNVVTLPTSGPLLIMPPALQRWGSPRRQGLCSHLAHKWATSDSAYHRLRLNSAATPTAMNPSTNLPVRCKVLDCRKWHCTYAMPHHMAQAHPGVSHDYAECSEEEKTKVLQAFDNFRAPLPPKAKPAAPPALPTVLPALLSGPNQGSSSSGSSSSSSSTTNASSSTSASSSSSAPSGTSDYVPSESVCDKGQERPLGELKATFSIALKVLQCSKTITIHIASC